MLATTMPSYRFSASRAPRCGSRSPAISEAAVSTSRAASCGHTDRSQVPGSSRTTARLARKPAVTTSPMNQRSRGGSPLKVIPPFRGPASFRSRAAGRRLPPRPAGLLAWLRSVPGPAPGRRGRHGPRRRPAGGRPGAGRPAARGPAPGRPVDGRPAPGRPAPRRPGQLGPAAGGPAAGGQVLGAQARSAQLRAAQLRATQSTAPPSPPLPPSPVPPSQLPPSPVPPSPVPSRVAARTPPQDHWRTAQPAGASPASDHCLAAQTRASHCWAAQLLADQPSTAQRQLSQGWAVQASVSTAPTVGPGSPSAGAQRSPSAPPVRQPSPSGGSDGAGGGADGRPTARSGYRSPLATRSGTGPRAAARSSAPAPDSGAVGASGSAVPVRAALTRSGPQPGWAASTRAAAPATTAVDIEVPDPRK
jgi:hypothetical protein